MSSCPACGVVLAEEDRSCPACGSGEDIADSPTGTAPRPARGSAPTPSPLQPRTPSDPAGRPRAATERFVPGTVLAGRYRIIGLLGSGGMGEVYRADDLRLDQPVALKFLPDGLAADEERLGRFYREVRLARQVSHPAVCRVYDLGEAEGHLFLSMELVDGENLASLLRRIGRLPADKALDIARQLCAGLAAAHEKGVLHRDLKPANVMLDGQGNVRITDFGLAGLAEQLEGEDVRSGTPSYMSPEQLLGREVTVRSDIYGLGLLLYELFTGRRAFSGRTLGELARKHRDDRVIEPSALVAGLDPAVERAILACLEKDPRRRPASALVVSAMLTGADPLEAVIAAGETPSPELVAAAGEREGLRPGVAWGLLGLVLGGLLLAPVAGRSFRILELTPAEKPPAVLEDRARELLRRVSAAGPAADDAWGLTVDWGFLGHVRGTDASPARWSALAAGSPAIQFWYRESPRPLVSLLPSGRVYSLKPGLEASGMAGATYGMQGRLLRFYVVPPQLEAAEARTTAPVDWSALFAEAGLDPSALRAVEPRWVPPFHAHERAAWEGEWPASPPIPVRVEAAAFAGRPVWFEVVWPWSRPERMEKYTPPPGKIVRQAVLLVVSLVLVGAAAFMARRNVVLGRGDRRGAFRVAGVLAGLGFAGFVLGAHHVADWNAETGVVMRGLGYALLPAAFTWLFYLAVEPYARRLRPWTLVSWTRLFGGGVADPVVGRDTLVGLAYAVILAHAAAGLRLLAVQLGQPAPEPVAGFVDTLQGAGVLGGAVLGALGESILAGLGLLLLFVLLRAVLRRDLLASAGLLLVLFGPGLVAGYGDNPWLMGPLAALSAASWIFVLLRFGLLAAIVGWFASDLLQWFPLATDLSSWAAGPTLLILALVGALAVVAFRSAAGGTGLRRYLGSEAPSRP